jgi:tetratricopeptide (TPR) repeat protein
LVQISNTSWVANNSILTQLASCNDQAIVPTTWLINTLNSVTTFSLLDSEGSPRLYNNLKWGKPILPSNLIGIQPGMHNVQFQQRQFSAFFGTSFFLLHLTQFPEQRIAVNRKKLLSNGFVESGLTNQEIMKLDLANPIAMRFIVEMRAMHRIIRGDPPPADHTLTGNLTLEPNGRISYSNANADFGFSSFLQKGPTLIASLSAGEEALATESDDAVALLTHALERRGQGDGDRAERLLLLGLSLYPDFLDQYAMPAFRKELIRTYLARRQWSKAEELAPKNGDAVAETWHYVLFARAFSQAGDDQAAYNWWNLVLDQSPNNREAMDAVGRECHRDTQPRA